MKNKKKNMNLIKELGIIKSMFFLAKTIPFVIFETLKTGNNWRFCFFKRTNCELLKDYEELLRLEFKSEQYMQQYQKKKLESLLEYAYKNVPYYSKALKPLFVKGKLDLTKFDKIPFLTKEIMRKQQDQLISKVFPKEKMYVETSGGSTGEPVKLIHDTVFWNKAMAIKLYYNHVLGKEFGEKELKLWGSERDVFKGSIGLKAKVDNFLYNRLLLNSFRMTPAQMRKYAHQWNKFKPKSVWAYVDAIYGFAKFIEKNKIKMYKPAFIIATAGTVHEDVRKYIEKVFQTKVYNQYGSREIGDAACECPLQEGLHLMDFSHVVEVVNREGKPAKYREIGEIAVTALDNYSMPIIRYKIGDTAILSNKKPKCGRHTHLLKAITGRVTSIFRTRDGRIIPSQFFIHFVGVVYKNNGIGRFQVIQEDYDRIRVKVVVSDRKAFNVNKTKISDSIKLVMGKETSVVFEEVKEINPLKSGKYEYTISKIKV